MFVGIATLFIVHYTDMPKYVLQLFNTFRMLATLTIIEKFRTLLEDLIDVF